MWNNEDEGDLVDEIVKVVTYETENENCCVRRMGYDCKIHGRGVATWFWFNGEPLYQCPACHCKQQYINYMGSKRIADMQKARLRKQGVAPEFYEATVNCFEPRSDSQGIAKQRVRELCEGKLNKVVLLGGNGVGKTHLACAAVKHLGGRRVTAYEVGLRIRATFGMKTKSEMNVLEELSWLPFLAIDELGRVKNNELSQDWLSYVVDKRHTQGLPLMICSNTHFRDDCKQGGCNECFEKLVGSDVLSRLQQNSSFVTIEGPDGRKCA